MRVFSYRNRRKFKKILLWTLAILGVLLIVFFCAVAYLDRYVVYDHNGARIDRTWSQQSSGGTETSSAIDAEINYVNQSETTADTASRKISGYYVTLDMLKSNLSDVKTALESGTYYAVLLDLKDDYGYCYYKTAMTGEKTASGVDADAVSALISELKGKNVYLIARIPAFVDQRRCLNNTSLGLPVSNGSLWSDQNNCYWMDPGNGAVLKYLETVCTELQGLGFQEVVLDRFQFPSTTSIVYSEKEKTKDQVLAAAAVQLQSDLAALSLKVSFGVSGEAAFPTQISTGRFYLSLQDGAKAAAMADTMTASVVTPATQLVFVTQSRDTRFDDYGHLLPAVESTAKKN